MSGGDVRWQKLGYVAVERRAQGCIGAQQTQEAQEGVNLRARRTPRPAVASTGWISFCTTSDAREHTRERHGEPADTRFGALVAGRRVAQLGPVEVLEALDGADCARLQKRPTWLWQHAGLECVAARLQRGDLFFGHVELALDLRAKRATFGALCVKHTQHTLCAMLDAYLEL